MHYQSWAGLALRRHQNNQIQRYFRSLVLIVVASTTLVACELDKLLSPGAVSGGTPADNPNGNTEPIAKRLVFVVQPANTMADGPLSPFIKIAAVDESGATVANFAGAISVEIATNPAGAVLSGTATQIAVAGVATFSSISIGQSGTGYRLRATASGLTSVMSDAFNIMSPPVQPNTLSLVSGNAQTGTVGTALANPYIVQVKNPAGQGLPGITVAWTVVTGGGSIAQSSVTNASGNASATLTLGATVGTQRVTASVAGATGSPVTFDATGTAAPPPPPPPVQPNTLSLVSGNGQSATVGTALANPYVVRVTNSGGQGVSGITVTWTTVSGGGSIAQSSVTNATGNASATHTLGSTVGTQRVTAAVSGTTGSPVTFDATGTAVPPPPPPPTPNSLSLVSGNTQSATVGTALANPYVVRLTNSAGQGVAGVTVTWTVVSGGGSIAQSSVTNSSGNASATHTLGQTVGTQRVTASVAGATGSPVTFDATGIAVPPPPPPQPNILLSISGNGQTATVGTALANPYVIQVRNAAGAGVPGISVTWTVISGGGSIAQSTTTNSSGNASATHTLGATVGAQRVTASVAGATNSPITFEATGTAPPPPPPPVAIARVSGNSQTDTITATLQPYVVRVTNASGNPVAGVTVSWSISGSNGGSLSATSSQTNASGLASVTHTLGTVVGSWSVLAAVAGLQGSPITFSSTVIVGRAAQLVFTQQPTNSERNEDIEPKVKVAVRDRGGNTVTAYNTDITMSITPSTGTPGATLSGDRTDRPSGGTSTYDDLRINLTGNGYRLRATSGSLVVDSAPFNITP